MLKPALFIAIINLVTALLDLVKSLGLLDK